MAEARVIDGQHEHEGCSYFAPLFHVEGCGDFWFCNKCGNGGEVFPPAPLSGREEPS